MKHLYCLPIIKSNKKDVLAAIQKHKATYAYFEVWVDYIEDLDMVFLQKLSADMPRRLVVVFRRQNLEPIQMSLEQRYKALSTLTDTQVLVDLDIKSQQQEIAYIQKHNLLLQTILSYHNYQKTPEQGELLEIVQQIRKNNPTILKIATNCQNEKDALRLLDLQLTLKQNSQKHIVLGMGAQGLITRVFGSLWGNELIFAPEEAGEESAPGQLTRKQLDNILGIIGE